MGDVWGESKMLSVSMGWWILVFFLWKFMWGFLEMCFGSEKVLDLNGRLMVGFVDFFFFVDKLNFKYVRKNNLIGNFFNIEE